MTVDELIDLTSALLEDELHLSVSALRGGAGEALANVDDEQFLLAVRFLAGERPEAGPISRRLAQREPVPVDEDAFARRLAEIEELDEETPVGAVDLGDGVTLGFD